MTSAEHRLLLSGVLLFLAGLVLGFLIPVMPNGHAALTAHLNAVQSGTFVVALGTCWERFRLGPRISGLLSHAAWISFWGLEVGIIIMALTPKGATPGGFGLAGTLLGGVSTLVMTLTVASVVVALARPRSD